MARRFKPRAWLACPILKSSLHAWFSRAVQFYSSTVHMIQFLQCLWTFLVLINKLITLYSSTWCSAHEMTWGLAGLIWNLDNILQLLEYYPPMEEDKKIPVQDQYSVQEHDEKQ